MNPIEKYVLIPIVILCIIVYAIHLIGKRNPNGRAAKISSKSLISKETEKNINSGTFNVFIDIALFLITFVLISQATDLFIGFIAAIGATLSFKLRAFLLNRNKKEWAVFKNKKSYK